MDADGLVHAHQSPGLGVEIDFDLIEKNKLLSYDQAFWGNLCGRKHLESCHVTDK